MDIEKLRKIIHIDMDAFFASVEQRDNPEYRGRPLVVGYPGERGVVAAASYEARKYGVRSAMSSKMALAKCPFLIFAPGRFDAYKAVSRQIHEIFHDYTDLVEPLSLDEAFLDITVNHKNMPSATIIAQEIKTRIFETTGLTASAGVSINKFIAKIASDIKKPDGLFVVTAEEAEAFVESLEIEKFWGVGRVTAQKMHRIGIHTGADLKKRSEDELTRHFGKAGHMFYRNARAIDDRPVIPDQIRKSIGAENTFMTDIDDREELNNNLESTADDVWQRVSKREFYGRTVTLKIKYHDFEQVTRSYTHSGFVTDQGQLLDTARSLLANLDFGGKKVRLMGLTVSNIQEIEQPKAYQLEFNFDWE